MPETHSPGQTASLPVSIIMDALAATFVGASGASWCELPQVLPRVMQIDDLHRARRVLLGKIPDPFGTIAQDHLLSRAAPTALPGFHVDPLAKLFGHLDGAVVGGGNRIADIDAGYFVRRSSGTRSWRGASLVRCARGCPDLSCRPAVAPTCCCAWAASVQRGRNVAWHVRFLNRDDPPKGTWGCNDCLYAVSIAFRHECVIRLKADPARKPIAAASTSEPVRCRRPKTLRSVQTLVRL